MVDASGRPPRRRVLQHLLEVRMVLAQVMPETCESRPLGHAQFLAKASSPVGNGLEVVRQRMPPTRSIRAVRDRL
jgi:hypothetical protein